MTVTYNCTKEMVKNSPAVVHVDHTARPQIINAYDNPLMHQILLLWHKNSGGMSLINTSFNKHEEPIVCSPKDAIDALVQDQVDVLVIGNYFVYKS
jgi:carbamoyltransferase